jgi:hypothetical protein
MNAGRSEDFIGKVPDFGGILLDSFGKNLLYFGIILDYSEIHRVFIGKFLVLSGNMSVNCGRIAEYFGISGEFEALLSKLWVKANAFSHPLECMLLLYRQDMALRANSL